jgi:ADP-ribosylglycohydrolase
MKELGIIGAIAGDIIGSVYEFRNVKSIDFPMFTDKSTFTDDTVLTIAVADSIINSKEYGKTLHTYGRNHIRRGYGPLFHQWLLNDNLQPYGSYGNGSGMRVSPVGLAYSSLAKVLKESKKSAEVTHNHPEGIKGAQAIAAAIFMARNRASKNEIKNYISNTFEYDLSFTLDEIRPIYEFSACCQDSVPQSIVAFLESSDYENAIRLAISIGGDSDTIACMTGGIAAVFYNSISDEIIKQTLKRLPPSFIEIIYQFSKLNDIE